MPLFPPVKRYSARNSKSDGEPPRQIRKVFCLGIVPGFVSPTTAPFSTRQYAGSPSQPFRVLPSNIGTKLCCATSAGMKSAARNAVLRLRYAQSKRIQLTVLGADIDAASTNRWRAEVRESTNCVRAREQHLARAGVQRVVDGMACLRFPAADALQIAVRPEV